MTQDELTIQLFFFFFFGCSCLRPRDEGWVAAEGPSCPTDTPSFSWRLPRPPAVEREQGRDPLSTWRGQVPVTHLKSRSPRKKGGAERRAWGSQRTLQGTHHLPASIHLQLCPVMLAKREDTGCHPSEAFLLVQAEQAEVRGRSISLTCGTPAQSSRGPDTQKHWILRCLVLNWLSFSLPLPLGS